MNASQLRLAWDCPRKRRPDAYGRGSEPSSELAAEAAALAGVSGSEPGRLAAGLETPPDSASHLGYTADCDGLNRSRGSAGFDLATGLDQPPLGPEEPLPFRWSQL